MMEKYRMDTSKGMEFGLYSIGIMSQIRIMERKLVRNKEFMN